MVLEPWYRDHILSYDGFSNAFMERFERKDPELPFKELAQLKQVGTPKGYMLEFEKYFSNGLWRIYV